MIQDTVMLAMMGDKDAPKSAINLAPYMLSTISTYSNKENLLHITQSQLAELIGSTQKNVSQTLTLLKRWGFLAQVKTPVGGKCLMVNPQVRFIGTGKSSTAYVEKTQKFDIESGEITTKTTRSYGRNKMYEEMMKFYLENKGAELPVANDEVQRLLNPKMIQVNHLLSFR